MGAQLTQLMQPGETEYHGITLTQPQDRYSPVPKNSPLHDLVQGMLVTPYVVGFDDAVPTFEVSGAISEGLRASMEARVRTFSLLPEEIIHKIEQMRARRTIALDRGPGYATFYCYRRIEDLINNIINSTAWTDMTKVGGVRFPNMLAESQVEVDVEMAMLLLYRACIRIAHGDESSDVVDEIIGICQATRSGTSRCPHSTWAPSKKQIGNLYLIEARVLTFAFPCAEFIETGHEMKMDAELTLKEASKAIPDAIEVALDRKLLEEAWQRFESLNRPSFDALL